MTLPQAETLAKVEVLADLEPVVHELMEAHEEKRLLWFPSELLAPPPDTDPDHHLLELRKRAEGVSLRPVLNDPSSQVKVAAFTQHPRPAYYDREPDKLPKLMGYSVRTTAGRYTEWRDWKTGAVTATEFYDHDRDPAEMRNQTTDSPALADARQRLRRQFPLKP